MLNYLHFLNTLNNKYTYLIPIILYLYNAELLRSTFQSTVHGISPCPINLPDVLQLWGEIHGNMGSTKKRNSDSVPDVI